MKNQRKDRWIDTIVEALENLKGKGTKKEINAEVKKIRQQKGLSWDSCKTPSQTISRVLQGYPKDAKYLQGKVDLFKRTNMGGRVI